MVVSVVEADNPPGTDTVDLIMGEAFDIPSQSLGLLPLFLMYLGHLCFSYFFSR